MVEEAAKNRTADEQRRELVELRNTGDSLAYQAEKLLKDMGDKVPEDQRSKVENSIKELREAVQGEDKARIQKLVDSLQGDLQAIGQAAYQQPGAAPQGSPGGQAPSGESGDESGDDEDVVEGEYREA
jgi:molecular chaperone DnaK